MISPMSSSASPEETAETEKPSNNDPERHLQQELLPSTLFIPTLIRTWGRGLPKPVPGKTRPGFRPMPPPPEPLPEDRELAERNARLLAADAVSTELGRSPNATMDTDGEQSLPSNKTNQPVETSSQVVTFTDGAASATASAVPSSSEIEDLPEELPEAGPFSDQIYIAGFNVQARYIAHALAGLDSLPPVQILTQHHDAALQWAKENRSIALHDFKGAFISRRPFLCPQYVGARQSRIQKLATQPTMINNLIVSLHDHALFPLMRRLKRHVDQYTTICLMSEGLGYIEDLNEQIFDDPDTRPQYIIGYSHHRVRKHPGSAIAIRYNNFTGGSNLYLSAPAEGPFVADAAPRTQVQHFLKLLSLSPEVRAKKLPWNRLVQRKLPEMVYSSLVDAISVMLGCRHSKIVTQPHARKLWKAMLSETLGIISAMPEVEPKVMQHFLSPEFRAELWGKLTRQSDSESRWISLIRSGRRPPANHINGYFVRRGIELGVDHKYNATALSIVDFKYHLRRNELQRGISFGNLAQQSYVTDESQHDEPDIPYEPDYELDA